MSIRVGINENVIITKAAFNDKGRMELAFKQLQVGESNKKRNFFEELNANKQVDQSEGNNARFQILTFLVPKNSDKKTWTAEEKVDIISNDITKTKNQLQQILEQYMTTDNIKWDIWDGTGINSDNYNDRIVELDILTVVYKNICTQFIEMITPFLGKEEYLMRLKLIRQSKDKHFAMIPKEYVKDNPFIEPMDVPHPVVKFTDYEIKQGLNSGTPIAAETADEPGEAPAGTDGDAGFSLFGQR